MVLCLKTWESRSPPGLPRARIRTTPTGCCLNAQDLQTIPSHTTTSDGAIAPLHGRLSPRRATARLFRSPRRATARLFRHPRRATARLGLPPTAATAGIGNGAGWSSPVARQAHNLKAAGSNPAPATNLNPQNPNPPKPGQPAGPNAFTVRQGRAVLRGGQQTPFRRDRCSAWPVPSRRFLRRPRPCRPRLCRP